MAGEIGKLSAIITANAQGLFSTMDAAEKRMKRFGDIATSALGGLGIGLGVGGLGAAVKSAVDDAGRLVDVSSKLGIGVGPLEQLELAAKTSGVEAQTLHNALSKLQAKIGEAARGEAAAVKDFEAMGVSWRELAASSPDDAFAQVAERIGSMTDAYQRADAAQQLFGKGGKELIPLMRDFRGEMDLAGGALVRFGDEAVQRLDAAGDSWERLKASVASGFKSDVVRAAEARAGENVFGNLANLLNPFAGAQGRMGGMMATQEIPGVKEQRLAERMAAERAKEAAAAVEAGHKEFDEFAKAWDKWAGGIVKDARDPLQQVAEQIENIRFAFAQGFITNEADFRRALAKAEQIGKSTADLHTTKFPRADFAAKEFGGVGAGSAINRFLNQRAGVAQEGRDKELRFLAEIAGGIRELAGAWGVADVGQ